MVRMQMTESSFVVSNPNNVLLFICCLLQMVGENHIEIDLIYIEQDFVAWLQKRVKIELYRWGFEVGGTSRKSCIWCVCDGDCGIY